MIKFPLKARTQNILSFLLIATFIAVGWLYKPDSTIPLKSPFTEEQRKKIDARLFSELAVRGHNWVTMGKTLEARYEFIKSYADQGYEIAELMLKLFDFSGANPSSMTFDEEAFQRLKDLAKQDDASAQCLYADAGLRWGKMTYNEPVWRQYILMAADQKHPSCLTYKAHRYFDTGNISKAHSLYEAAARLGNNQAQSGLVLFYSMGSFGYPKDIGKAQCWYQIASQPEFDTGKGHSSVSTLLSFITEEKRKGVTTYKDYSIKSWCKEYTQTKPLASLKKELGYD